MFVKAKDQVVVISGKDKGVKGKVITAAPKTGKVAVETMVNDKTDYHYFNTMQEAQDYVTQNGFEDATIRKTNLEDVFVELTGKSVGGQL